jgi:Dullard-like phosphatase family protein
MLDSEMTFHGEDGEHREPQDASLNHGLTVALPPQSDMDMGRMTVVLDLDETLIHAEHWDPNCAESLPEVAGAMVIKSDLAVSLIRKRPFVEEFLREASKRFELIVFTAGSEEYASPILDDLDPNKTIFRHRLFRQHCAFKCGANFVKDLRILNRDMQKVVLVDNNPYSFLVQPNNGIPISSFIDDPSDKALVTLFDFLLALSPGSDVRLALRSTFGLDTMLGTVPPHMLTPTRHLCNSTRKNIHFDQALIA